MSDERPGTAPPFVAISLVGTTGGLELCTFPEAHRPIKDEAVLIDDSEVTLTHADDVYVVRRLFDRGVALTWVGIYRKAYEIVRARGGGYYGAGIWLFDHTASGVAIAELLQGLRKQVEKLALTEGKFIRRLSDIRGELRFSELKTTLADITQSLQPCISPPTDIPSDLASAYVDMCEPTDRNLPISWLLDWVQEGGSLFGAYSRVVIGTYPDAFGSSQSSLRARVITPSQLRRKGMLGYLESLKSVASSRHSLEVERAANAEALQAACAENMALLSQIESLKKEVFAANNLPYNEIRSLSHELSRAITRLDDIEGRRNIATERSPRDKYGYGIETRTSALRPQLSTEGSIARQSAFDDTNRENQQRVGRPAPERSAERALPHGPRADERYRELKSQNSSEDSRWWKLNRDFDWSTLGFLAGAVVLAALIFFVVVVYFNRR